MVTNKIIIMSIDVKIPANFDKVNTNELGELLWWTAHLGIGPEKLLSIINIVGNTVKDIRKYQGIKVVQH